MRNRNKEYRAEGLTVDTNHGRMILCLTGTNLFRWIALYTCPIYGVVANRWNDDEKFLPNRTIKENEVREWIETSWNWKVKRIRQPNKLRIVCS